MERASGPSDPPDCRAGDPSGWARSEAYICGGRQMIDDVKRLLLTKGFKAEHIHHENFY